MNTTKTKTPVRYLVLNLESLARDNRFVWSHDTQNAARFGNAQEAEAVKGMVQEPDSATTAHAAYLQRIDWPDSAYATRPTATRPRLGPNLLSSVMHVRSSPREKAFYVGLLLAFLGLVALVFPNLPGFLRVAAGCCLVVGFLLYKGAFFVLHSGPIGILRKTPQGAVWLRTVALILWIGILPILWLWVYDRIHRH